MAEENKRRPTKEVTEEERLALAQNILKSVGLEEFPKGSAESFERLYDTLDISRDDDLGKNPSRVSDAERKELEQLESKSRLNPTKFKDEFLSKRDNIIKRDNWYKNYDAARNKVIEDIAPYVSSLGALPSSSFYQSNVRRANRADTAEKINDILERARESVFSKNRERRDWFDSFTAKPTLAVASPDSVPAYTPTMGETKPSGFSKIESSVPSSFSPVSIGGSIDKRKLLAEELRRFAAGESQETAKSLKEQGGEIGVSPTQLSALYQKYKSEGGTGSTFAQQEEQARARSEAAGAFGGEGQRGKSSFAQQEEQARARSEAAGAFGGEGQRGKSSAGFIFSFIILLTN